MYHWLFQAQPHPIPETLLANEPSFYVDYLIDNRAVHPERLDPEAIAEYDHCYENERVIRARCVDYQPS